MSVRESGTDFLSVRLARAVQTACLCARAVQAASAHTLSVLDACQDAGAFISERGVWGVYLDQDNNVRTSTHPVASRVKRFSLKCCSVIILTDFGNVGY